MPGRMRTRIAAAAAALVTCTGAVLLATPAGAVGDPSLDRAIAVTPPAGWVLAPASVSEAQAAQQEQIVGVADQLEVASKEWTQPNSTNDLTVTLVAFTPSDIAQVEGRVDAERATCGAGQTEVTAGVPGIAGAKETTCSTTQGGTTTGGAPSTYGFTTIGWFAGDTYATVRAIGLPSPQVAADAREVARSIPTGGFSAPSAGSSDDLLPVIVAAVAAAAVAGALVVVWRRRQASGSIAPVAADGQPFPAPAAAWNPVAAYSPAAGRVGAPTEVMRQPTEVMAPLPAFQAGAAPAAAPGWHALPGDPTKTAYWDGARWAAFRQWDGNQWVDAAALRR
jgi:hypothetical protein